MTAQHVELTLAIGTWSLVLGSYHIEQSRITVESWNSNVMSWDMFSAELNILAYIKISATIYLGSVENMEIL